MKEGLCTGTVAPVGHRKTSFSLKPQNPISLSLCLKHSLSLPRIFEKTLQHRPRLVTTGRAHNHEGALQGQVPGSELGGASAATQADAIQRGVLDPVNMASMGGVGDRLSTGTLATPSQPSP